MKRLFIGLRIVPEKEYKKVIQEVKNDLADEKIKWTEENNIHITLAFLGNTDEQQIPRITEMLKDRCSAASEFELVLRSLGVFKGLKDPKVLWAGIEPSEKINALQLSITEGLKTLSIPVDEKPFSPHITIGRIKNISDPGRLRTILLKHHSRDLQKSIIREVILFESILRQEGPVYVPLATFKLLPAL